jgi:uncharacterized membrane protein
MNNNRQVLTMAVAAGAGVTGGVFFVFSDFTMRALRRLPPRLGLTAMQAINRAAPSPLFMGLLLGTAAASAVLGVKALADRDDPGAGRVVVGALLYLTSIGLTIGYHVPRNEALGRVDPAAVGAAEAWSRYASDWTRWNHLRTAASTAAMAAFLLALTPS